MQMNIPSTLGPICFSGSLEEDWNVYDERWTIDERRVMAIAHLTRREGRLNIDYIQYAKRNAVVNDSM